MASAPFSTSILAAAPVATLPTTMSIPLNAFLASTSLSMTPLECPWAVSMMIASAPASTRACMRSSVSTVTPTPAATRRRPFSSLQAIGLSLAFVISLYVMSPTRRLLASTTGSFSILFSWSISAAAARSVCWWVVTRFSEVMTSSIALSMRRSKRRSRFVTMPTRWPSSSTTGMPPM